MAAGEGFEPSHTESESAVLPLHKPAIFVRSCRTNRYYYTGKQEFVKVFFEKNNIRKCYRKTRRMKQSFGLYFFPGKGVRVMACKYLDFQDRKKIAKMYQEEARVLDIAYKIGCHPATIYEELRRGDTGKLDKNQRPEYDPRLAQRTFQEAIRRRGNRRTTTTAESGQ